MGGGRGGGGMGGGGAGGGSDGSDKGGGREGGPAADSVIVPVTEGARSVRSTKDWNAVLPRAESQPVDEVLGLHVPLKTATRLVDAPYPYSLYAYVPAARPDTYT